MTDEQIRAAIEVLKAYAAGDLALDNDILDELETAIEEAFNASLSYEPNDYEHLGLSF